MENTSQFYLQKIVDYVRRATMLDATRSIPLDESLLEAGVFDSFGIVELLTFVEGEFDIAIPDEDVTKEKMGSIRKLADYALQHRLATQ